jgi:hypothetical protein
MADKMRQDAIIRKLEVVGEAVKNVSKMAKQDGPKSRGAGSQVCATGSARLLRCRSCARLGRD